MSRSEDTRRVLGSRELLQVRQSHTPNRQERGKQMPSGVERARAVRLPRIPRDMGHVIPEECRADCIPPREHGNRGYS